jgi:hypothetical protein
VTSHSGGLRNRCTIFGTGDKRAGRDIGEGHDHVDERDPDEREHRAPRACSEPRASDFSYRARAVANGRRQRGHVVDGPDEHDAESDPQQTREPAESLARENRPRNGSRGRDRGEVLGEKIERSRRHEVHVITQLVGRRDAGVVDRKLPGDPPSVDAIGQRQDDEKNYREQREIHRIGIPWAKAIRPDRRP